MYWCDIHWKNYYAKTRRVGSWWIRPLPVWVSRLVCCQSLHRAVEGKGCGLDRGFGASWISGGGGSGKGSSRTPKPRVCLHHHFSPAIGLGFGAVGLPMLLTARQKNGTGSPNGRGEGSAPDLTLLHHCDVTAGVELILAPPFADNLMMSEAGHTRRHPNWCKPVSTQRHQVFQEDSSVRVDHWLIDLIPFCFPPRAQSGVHDLLPRLYPHNNPVRQVQQRDSD